MKTLLWKIAGSVVLVLAVVIVVKIFWSTETEPVTESKRTGQNKQVQEKNTDDLEIQPGLQQPDAKLAFKQPESNLSETIEEEGANPEAEKLYQMALSCKVPRDSQDASHRIMVECCRQILKEYPNSPQAPKARDLLQQYNVPEEATGFPYASQPKVKKSRTLRRRQRSVTRYRRHYNISDEEVSPSN
jgi:hypothetical protein